MASVNLVNVILWGQHLGAIIADEQRPGYYLFQYADDLPAHLNPSPINMPVNQSVYSFNLDKDTYQGLPGMISDSLPDKFGNALVSQYMESRGIAANQVTTLDRLLYTGKRGMGALEFEPSKALELRDHYPLAMSDLVESARKAIQGNFSQVASDFLIVSLIDEPFFSVTIPAKTQAYIVARKPILAIINGDVADL